MNSDNIVGIDRETSARESGAANAEVDVTLRLIASLPAPEGLEDRVHGALRSGHVSARGSARVIELPVRWKTDGSWSGNRNSPFLRGAAAAAIAFAVVGGGWGVYSRVQTAKVIPMPSQQQHGFSNAGAKHTPQTLNGPTIHHAQPAPHVVEMPARNKQSAATGDPSTTPPAAAPQEK
jgi:hypothetical protein